MTPLKDTIVRYIDERLDAITDAPPMWGSDEAVEMQVLQLLELRALTLRPEVERGQPRAVLDAYVAFLRRKFPKEPCMNLAALLEKHAKQGDMSPILEEFRREMMAKVPEEPLFGAHDLVIVLWLGNDVGVPRASTLSSYYDVFHRVLRALTRERGTTRGRAPRDLEVAIDFAMPEVGVFPANGVPAHVVLPLDQPPSGRQSVHAASIREALAQIAIVSKWAADRDSPVDELQRRLDEETVPRRIAAQTLRLVPSEGMKAVDIGGKLMGSLEPVQLRPELARRVVGVIKEGQVPRPYTATGSVRAVDIDRGSMRLRVDREPRGASIICWIEDRDLVALAQQLLGRPAQVTGQLYGNPAGNDFVIVEQIKSP